MTAPTTEAPPEQTEEAVEPLYGDQPTIGHLLDPGTKPEDICKWVHDEWIAQHDKYARRIKEDEVNRRRRAGEGNIWVEKDSQDQHVYRIYEAHGGKFSQFYQKGHRLCLRAVAVLHPDPPEPEAIPDTGEDEDRDAAEFTTRALKDVGSESGCNMLEAHKRAFDLASNGGSAYVWYFADPYGGGRQPITVDAHPDAPTVDTAMVDPATGLPHKGDTVTKHVAPDGSLLPTSAGAARQWVPKLSREICSFNAIRLLPPTALDVWDATGLIYAKYHTWATAKGWFEELGELSDDDRDTAVKFRMKECEHLLPRKNGKPSDPKPKPGHEDDALVLIMIRWCLASPEYPDGCYLVTVGNKLVPKQEPWVITKKDGTTEPRDIPFTQIQQFVGDQDNPPGWGFMDFLGPSNENRGEITGAVLDMLDKLLNPKILLPIGSTLQPQDFDSPFNTTLRFQPGYEPKQMDGPKIPPEAFTLLEMIKEDMNDATGMGQASAEGMEAPNVQSGRHALAIASAQQASLADINQNINRAFTRGWRIQAQTVKAEFDVPQLLRFVDRDGGYKVKRWMGSDLGSTKDVQVKRGTGTLFNPAQKAEYVAQYAQMAGIPPDEIQELLATGFSPYTQIQDDPHVMRVRSQISAWEDGPLPGWAPPLPPEPTVQGVDPATGQPVLGPPGPPPPYDPVFGSDQRPVDTTPIAAGKRIREIGKAMAGQKYGKMPPEWKAALDQEFARMQQALAPPPPPGMPAGGPGGPPPPPDPNQPPPLTPQEQDVLGSSVGAPAGAVAP